MQELIHKKSETHRMADKQLSTVSVAASTTMRPARQTQRQSKCSRKSQAGGAGKRTGGRKVTWLGIMQANLAQ